MKRSLDHKIAVAINLPQNVNILETLDDNELLKRYHVWFGGYPYYNFYFDYIPVFIFLFKF